MGGGAVVGKRDHEDEAPFWRPSSPKLIQRGGTSRVGVDLAIGLAVELQIDGGDLRETMASSGVLLEVSALPLPFMVLRSSMARTSVPLEHGHVVA
jgi:hypothetical protein